MTISQENLALMIADELGEDKESVLIGLAADRAKTPQEQAIWANIAKKFNGLGLSSISMASGALALLMYTPKEALAQCALYALMFNASRNIFFSQFLNSLAFERVNNEVSRND